MNGRAVAPPREQAGRIRWRSAGRRPGLADRPRACAAYGSPGTPPPAAPQCRAPHSRATRLGAATITGDVGREGKGARLIGPCGLRPHCYQRISMVQRYVPVCASTPSSYRPARGTGHGARSTGHGARGTEHGARGTGGPFLSPSGGCQSPTIIPPPFPRCLARGTKDSTHVPQGRKKAAPDGRSAYASHDPRWGR